MKASCKYISLLGLTALLCASCSEDYISRPDEGGMETAEITLSAAYPTASRASDAGFEDGDHMGVYVMDYMGDTPEAITDADIHGDNVKFRFNGTDNSWTGATTLYWTSATTPADIIGYYPFIATIDDETAVPFKISRRQDTNSREDDEPGGYEASDLLWAKAEKVMPTSARVDLTFRHLMAGVRVALVEGSGFSGNEWSSLEKTVSVTNVIPDATVNLSDGEVSVGDGSPVSVTPCRAGEEWRAVVVPQTVGEGTTLLAITVDGVSYNFSKTGTMTYTPGKLHTFTITVNRTEPAGDYEFVLSDEAITAWLDDVEFREGIMREYIVVNVENRGTLEACVKAMNLKEKDIRNLKITGEMDERDFTYLREKFEYLSALNLSDAEVYSDNKRTVLPSNAFYGKSMLAHIVFPKHLTVIGNCAFFETGLMGDLIIPEGVTHIGTGEDLDGAMPGHWGGAGGAFTNCFSLVGSLSLPSTLTFIESGAFCRTSLTGELVIPESVRFIGSCAFDNTKFTGSLTLPDNIEDIGVGAFYQVKFTGNLVIPQGVEKIRKQTFSGGNYSLLSLPEGLIEIDDQAFTGCEMRGELKLPSTLKMIGANAFEDNKFSNIVFPERINYLGKECFIRSSRLTSVTIPDGLTAINRGLFAQSNMLEEVIIGEEITKIEGFAFGECYNLASVTVNNPEPPLLLTDEWDGRTRDAFYGVPRDNFTLQVPESSVELYNRAAGWKEFKRIAAYSNFVCRPAAACALNSRHEEYLILNSDGDWEVTHLPEWCSLSRSNGSGKTEILLTVNEMAKGSGNRSDYVEFALKGTDFTTRCAVSQYDYQYGEDECVTLQKATRGTGVDLLFIGDGFDAAAIAEGEYLELVNEQVEAFFGVEPYTTYRDYFNVYACMGLSQETGINTLNTWRNTRFQTYYGNDGGLLLDDFDAVMDYAVDHSPLTAARMPKSLVIMTLNSDEYGGATMIADSGSAISLCSRSSDPYPMDTRGIIQHEACGHAFGKLGEERILYNRYLTNGERQHIEWMQNRGWYQNISASGKMSDVPWSHFIFDDRYSVNVDVFEGAFGVTRGAYRSEINSCMNHGIPYFNAISRQDIMKRILEYADEEFTMDKFYATDSDKWGSTGGSRAAMPDEKYTTSALHHPITIVKSSKY